MITWLNDVARQHPLPFFAILGVVALGLLFAVVRRSGDGDLPPTPQVIGTWRLEDPKGSCHHGRWSVQVQAQSITVRDPDGTSRSSPCTVDNMPHGPALVTFRQDLGWGKDLHLAVFITGADGTTTMSLAKDETTPGCRHPVSRD